MIAFLNLQKKLSDAESENYELSEFFRLTHEGNQYLQQLLKFTVVAENNIDFNATLSTAIKNFRGTSMTVLEFPLAKDLGNDNSMPERTQLIDEQTKKKSKKVLKVPESYKTVKSLSIRKAPLYAPSVAVDMSQ